MSCFLAVGPTGYGLGDELEVAGLTILPPIRRGDVEALRQQHLEPGCLILVDGLFHSNLAVGHRELRLALEDGWTIWGLSSMGAIRAAEMAHLGLRGFGTVYGVFSSDPATPDDEVALLHAAEPPFRPLSEPLLHLRRAVAHLEREGVLGRREAARVLSSLQNRWYGERTLPQLQSLLGDLLGDGLSAAWTLLDDFDRFRIKTHDLTAFLKERPW